MPAVRRYSNAPRVRLKRLERFSPYFRQTQEPVFRFALGVFIFVLGVVLIGFLVGDAATNLFRHYTGWINHLARG